MEIYIAYLLQILSFSNRYRQFEMKNFLFLRPVVDSGDLEDSPTLVFINKECGNLILQIKVPVPGQRFPSSDGPCSKFS